MDGSQASFLDDDKHICLRCKRTIVGLDNYVIHRKSRCHELVNPPSSNASHFSREPIVEAFSLHPKTSVNESTHVTEPFSNDAIDLSTSTKRDLNDEDQQQNILFTNVALHSSSDPKNDHSKMTKGFSSTETYQEPYSEVDSYHPNFVNSRDQQLFLDYRSPTSSDHIRKEVFVGQQHFTSSGDLFHTVPHEPSSISLFRPFDAFGDHFKGNPDVVEHGNYFSQPGAKFISETSSFENKISDIYPTIHSTAENETFLSGENNSDSTQFKHKLLGTGSGELSTHAYHKSICYEQLQDKTKDHNPELQECTGKDNCAVALDCSKQEDLRQNDFLSSLELTSTVARKIMKYESDIDEDDDYYESRPPGHHTGGKWPPGTQSHPAESGKWIFSPPNVEEDSQDGFDTLNDPDIEHSHSFHPPPPSYTKGKWLPGKRMTSVKYGTSVEYECKSCDRILKGKTTYEKHLRSELHFVKENKNIGLTAEPSLIPTTRPVRAKKEKAQLFIKEKISEIKRKRHKAIAPSEKQSAKFKLKLMGKNELQKISAVRSQVFDDEETDEEIKTNIPKILCPICRLSFSETYCSQHFASLAHIHNELEFNMNPNCETNKAYNKIILKNIKSLVKASNFLCKSCNFFTNSHSDLQYHLSLSHVLRQENPSSGMKTVYKCSACSDENALYSVADLQRHLKVSQHQRNIEFEILQARQVVIHQMFLITCTLCLRTFRYNKAYLEHRQKFHKEETFQLVNQRLSRCSECNYQGINERQVRSHLKQKHLINYSNSYFCFVCGLRFVSRGEADTHRHSLSHRITLEKQKGKSTSRKCNMCYSIFENLTVLRQHMSEYHQKEVTPCPYCGIIPPLRSDLTVHQKSCSRIVVASGRTFKCDLCSYSNDLMAHVLMHAVFVHSEKKEKGNYLCHICKSQMQGRSVKNHMLLHTNEMKFSCNFCSRKFSQQTWLQSHLQIVHSLNLKENDSAKDESEMTADQSCLNRVNLPGIKGKIKKKKKSLCEICGRTYSNRSHLKRHQHDLHVGNSVTMETVQQEIGRETNRIKKDVITSSKSFVCEFCGIVCNNTAEFKSHRQSHRRNELAGESSFPCPHCDYSSPRLHHLRRHLRLHTGANPFKCPHCSYAANNQENLRKHMLKTQRHPDRRMYECQICRRQRITDESKAESDLSLSPNKKFPFGTNYAVEFKEHLTNHHMAHFRDKDEVMRHIRSYYHSDQDLAFTDNPKLFKYQFKRRTRKSQSHSYKNYNSEVPKCGDQEVVSLPSNVISSIAQLDASHIESLLPDFPRLPAHTFAPQHPTISQVKSVVDTSKVYEPRPEEPPAFLVNAEMLSKLTPEKSESDLGFDGDRCLGDENPSQMRSLSSFSSSTWNGQPLLPSPPETLPKRVRALINRDSKRASIRRESEACYHSLVSNPVGREVLMAPNLNSSQMILDEQREAESSAPKNNLVNASAEAISSKSIESCQDQFGNESKIQNLMSKKVYLLVANGRNIEEQIQDSLRWIDNL